MHSYNSNFKPEYCTKLNRCLSLGYLVQSHSQLQKKHPLHLISLLISMLSQAGLMNINFSATP